MVEQEKHIAMQDARAAATQHVVRYVLAISLALAVIAMLLVLWR